MGQPRGQHGDRIRQAGPSALALRHNAPSVRWKHQEWSFEAVDSGLPNTKGAAIPVYSQSDRADGYERYVEGALGLPFVVGLHWFQYVDQPILGRALDGENSNYGVVDVEDEPYFTLVERMRVVNQQAPQIAKRSRSLSDRESIDDDWLPF